MKKFLFLILISFGPIILFAQTKIAGFSGSFTFELSPFEKETAFDSLLAVFGYNPNCTLDSTVINDPDPTVKDSAAYIVFYADCHGSKFSFGLYLTKTRSHGVTEYYIDDDEPSVERAWECKTAPGCNICKPDRNWFLGPVVGCDCPECLFNTSGSGISATNIIALIGIIVTILLAN